MSHLGWYVARSAGLIAWVLLTAAVLWGLALSSKALGRRPHPAWLLDLHRCLGALATTFTVVHVLAVVADNYVHFTALSVLIPFVSTWRPGAIAWGVVSLYLVVAIEVTSLARKHLPKRAWRAVHFASLPLFLTATVHGVTAGSDTTSLVAKLLTVVSVGAVGAFTALRVAAAFRPASVTVLPVRVATPATFSPSRPAESDWSPRRSE
jgi:predicted ferric reductase